MLEVEVAANAVYSWAAERILERRLPGERPSDPAEYAGAVRMAAQELRYLSHERLMRSFLGPEVFEARSRSSANRRRTSDSFDSSAASEAAVQDRRIVEPRLLARAQLEQAPNTSLDQVELVVIDPVDEDHARM
jgi:hypothetical protein